MQFCATEEESSASSLYDGSDVEEDDEDVDDDEEVENHADGQHNNSTVQGTYPIEYCAVFSQKKLILLKPDSELFAVKKNLYSTTCSELQTPI